MEIISFVQDEPKKFSKPVIFTKKHKQNSFKFDTELKSFSAAKVHQKVTVKQVLIVIGQSVTATGKFIRLNYKKLLIALAAAAVTVVAGKYAIKLMGYTTTHTGPLTIAGSDNVDYENLNKLMASFALESPEVDEAGNIIDAPAVSGKVFTQPVTYQTYKVRSGDTISTIARKFGLSNISTLISVNDIGNVRQLAAGQKLKIPSMDGIVYTVKKGDSINSIVDKNKISITELLDVNDLSSETLSVGQVLFLPGAAMDSKSLQNAMGELFSMPIKNKFRWTSPFGPRIDPISGKRSSHTGVDMAAPTGTPIYASMSGRVSYSGVSNVFGIYVIINHGNGYQTMYAHMSKSLATKGQWVSQGTKIGLVGSTGYSTGPHLHFMVYKNGNLIDPKSVLK